MAGHQADHGKSPSMGSQAALFRPPGRDMAGRENIRLLGDAVRVPTNAWLAWIDPHGAAHLGTENTRAGPAPERGRRWKNTRLHESGFAPDAMAHVRNQFRPSHRPFCAAKRPGYLQCE